MIDDHLLPGLHPGVTVDALLSSHHHGFEPFRFETGLRIAERLGGSDNAAQLHLNNLILDSTPIKGLDVVYRWWNKHERHSGAMFQPRTEWMEPVI